jgi:hypothetical protein
MRVSSIAVSKPGLAFHGWGRTAPFVSAGLKIGDWLMVSLVTDDLRNAEVEKRVLVVP